MQELDEFVEAIHTSQLGVHRQDTKQKYIVHTQKPISGQISSGQELWVESNILQVYKPKDIK